MHADVRRRWDEANTYLPAIEQALATIPFGALGELQIASPEEDAKYATDYLLKLGIVSVGARVRRVQYLREYADFTIRSRIRSDVPTELDKWKLGIYPERYFYGWGDDRTLTAWMFIDVGSVIGRGLHLVERFDIPNGDGSFFVSFTRKELGSAILATSTPPPMTDMEAILAQMLADVRR